jgi:hypothetical protein
MLQLLRRWVLDLHEPLGPSTIPADGWVVCDFTLFTHCGSLIPRTACHLNGLQPICQSPMSLLMDPSNSSSGCLATEGSALKPTVSGSQFLSHVLSGAPSQTFSQRTQQQSLQCMPSSHLMNMSGLVPCSCAMSLRIDPDQRLSSLASVSGLTTQCRTFGSSVKPLACQTFGFSTPAAATASNCAVKAARLLPVW